MLYIDNFKIKKLYLDTAPIKRVYIDTTPVYTSAPTILFPNPDITWAGINKAAYATAAYDQNALQTRSLASADKAFSGYAAALSTSSSSLRATSGPYLVIQSFKDGAANTVALNTSTPVDIPSDAQYIIFTGTLYSTYGGYASVSLIRPGIDLYANTGYYARYSLGNQTTSTLRTYAVPLPTSFNRNTPYTLCFGHNKIGTGTSGGANSNLFVSEIHFATTLPSDVAATFPTMVLQ